MKLIVGCIVVKDDSFIIVKEAKKHVYGKWNLPLGHLDEDENIINGAKRESEEETGLKLKLTGFVGVYQNKESNKDGTVLKIILAAEPEGDDKIKFPSDELLDVKWVTFEDFFSLPVEDLRSKDVLEIVNDYKKRGVLPLSYLKTIGF